MGATDTFRGTGVFSGLQLERSKSNEVSGCLKEAQPKQEQVTCCSSIQPAPTSVPVDGARQDDRSNGVTDRGSR